MTHGTERFSDYEGKRVHEVLELVGLLFWKPDAPCRKEANHTRCMWTVNWVTSKIRRWSNSEAERVLQVSGRRELGEAWRKHLRNWDGRERKPWKVTYQSIDWGVLPVGRSRMQATFFFTVLYFFSHHQCDSSNMCGYCCVLCSGLVDSNVPIGWVAKNWGNKRWQKKKSSSSSLPPSRERERKKKRFQIQVRLVFLFVCFTLASAPETDCRLLIHWTPALNYLCIGDVWTYLLLSVPSVVTCTT